MICDVSGQRCPATHPYPYRHGMFCGKYKSRDGGRPYMTPDAIIMCDNPPCVDGLGKTQKLFTY